MAGKQSFDRILSFLSKEVGDNLYARMKPYNDVTSKDSPEWQMFVSYRNHGVPLPPDRLPAAWEGTSEDLKQATLRMLVRLRRIWEPWPGQAVHDLLGEIKWGITCGAGEDLLDAIQKCKGLAKLANDRATMLELLSLERTIVATYSSPGLARIEKLRNIIAERKNLLDNLSRGLGSASEEAANPSKSLRKRNPKPHRVKSDLLFRLAKTITPEECEQLRAYTRLNTKDSKRLRMFEYYYVREEWSKEQEQKDWRGEKLAQLKVRALAWLSRRMSLIGGWYGFELHSVIGDIQWAVHKGIGMFVLDWIENAIQLAASTESYEQLLLLEEIRRGVKGEDKIGATALRSILDSLEKIEEVQRIRLEYLEPIKLEGQNTGAFSATSIEDLLEVLKTDAFQELKPAEAIREVTIMRIFSNMALRRGEDAVEQIDRHVALLNAFPHLAESNWKQYFKDLRTSVLAYTRAGQVDKAEGLIQQMKSVGLRSPKLFIQSAMPRLLSILHMYDETLIDRYASQAMAVFESSKPLLIQGSEEKHQIWLNFILAKAYINFVQYQKAITLLNEVIDRKSRSNPATLAKSRVLLLLAYLGINMEPEPLFHAANACCMFIRRNMDKGVPGHLHTISTAIKRISEHQYRTAGQMEAFDNAIALTKEIASKATIGKSVGFHYHLALERIKEALKYPPK